MCILRCTLCRALLILFNEIFGISEIYFLDLGVFSTRTHREHVRWCRLISEHHRLWNFDTNKWEYVLHWLYITYVIYTFKKDITLDSYRFSCAVFQPRYSVRHPGSYRCELSLPIILGLLGHMTNCIFSTVH